MANCRKCGEELDPSSRYCLKCGQYKSYGHVRGFSSSIAIMVNLIAILVLFSWVSSNVLRPLFMCVSSGGWQEVSCTVKSSKLHREGNDYLFNVVYSYDFDGKEYTSNKYTFLPLKSSSGEDFSDLLKTFSKGKETVCYVNPSYPAVAVINRNLTALPFGAMEYTGLLVFLVLIVFLVYNINKSVKSKENAG